MSSAANTFDDSVTDGPIDLRRIPTKPQLLLTFSATLADGRRVAFGPSQLAVLVRVSTKQVLTILSEQVGIAYRTAVHQVREFPWCLIEVYGCAYRLPIEMSRNRLTGPSQPAGVILPTLPSLPWFASLDIERAFGVRGLSPSSIPTFRNVHRERWHSLRLKPDVKGP